MDEFKKNLNKLEKSLIGLANTNLPEFVPDYNSSESEKVISGKNNTFIVLGRDRPSDEFSGYGGISDVNSGQIDIVAGRISALDKEQIMRKSLKVNNDYFLDAARIVISQKTDIDDNFKLANGKIGRSVGKSGIGLKADSLRFIARNGIKLVTNTDIYDSNGNEIIVNSGIDLIANNDDSNLQPMVLGDNLSEYLKKISDDISKIYSELTTLHQILTSLFTVLAAHTHITGAPGSPTSPSVELGVAVSTASAQLSMHVIDTSMAAVKSLSEQMQYLHAFSEKYINSRYNNTN